LLINSTLSSAESLTIGLIADTHMPGTVDRLWQQVHEGFAHVDCILHAGDLHTAAVIEELDSIAPTYVCRGNGDLDVVHDRLADHWLGKLAGTTVGLIHRFPTPRRASVAKLKKKLDQHFGGITPRVVIYGHTHLAELHHIENTTYINPGSATLPNNQSTRLGTLGLLHIDRGSVSVELFQITERGLTLLEL
jgi:putative phosphoesterase